jgi:7-carboxy-7-deazaguanine synthase
MIPDSRLPLLVTETFGPTFQGEGASIGQPALFVRLSRCNLTCQWCDEPRTWDTSRFDLRDHTTQLRATDLADWARCHPVGLVVITGGEPLVQQQRLVDLVDQLLDAGKRVEIETNGTVAPLPALQREKVRFNVSPKLASSGVARERRIVPDALRALARTPGICKFVITAEHRDADLAEADELVATFAFEHVWLMPEATTRTALATGLRALAEPALARGWALSNRLHVELWENEHGR